MEPSAVVTSDYEIAGADEIQQFLVNAYSTSIRTRSDDRPHRLHHHRTDAGSVAMESADQSADLDIEAEPLNVLVVARTSSSRLERATAGADRRYRAGELFILNHCDRPYTVRRQAGGIHNCVIDPAVFTRVATPAPGRWPQPIRFTGLDPLTPALAGQWWVTRSYVADLLANPEAAASPLMIASAIQLIAAVTLAAFPNTAVADPTIEDRHDAHPDTLRRAVAFIDENAHTDITVADIAAHARVTIRAVQLTFRRHLDMTPMQYLRQVRLDHAHHDLTATDSSRTSVTTVAYRWGFASPSRFAASYREAYGITPSHTLHRD